ncbi:IgGFc-binding protein-like [Amphiura filiformis]|uniref:IgGFc-binding protein-like n=1 Tax=Amphiura filiformis TaxID=82378 RepID=UPI003B2232A2
MVVTLQQYESYQFVDHTNDDDTDVTGMFISADNPISVMSGHQCATVLAITSSDGCDYLMENLPPLSSLGNHYILAPFLGRTSGYVFRVVATTYSTRILISDTSHVTTTITLSAGSFYEGDVGTADKVLMITADKPIMVAQYAKAAEPYGPLMVVIPSIPNFSDNVTFPVPASITSNPKYYISIISECVNFNSFNMDNRRLNTKVISMLQAPDERFCILRTEVSPGPHSVTHPSASFLVLIYGFAKTVAYGYVAGYNIDTENTGDAAVTTDRSIVTDTSNVSITIIILASIIGIIALIIFCVVVSVIVYYIRKNRQQTDVAPLGQEAYYSTHLPPMADPHNQVIPNNTHEYQELMMSGNQTINSSGDDCYDDIEAPTMSDNQTTNSNSDGYDDIALN